MDAVYPSNIPSSRMPGRNGGRGQGDARGGCGGRGDHSKSGRGSGYSSKPKTTKVGLCKELEGHIFDYGGHGAAQAVALAARAAGTPFDPRSLDLPSIGALVDFIMPVSASQCLVHQYTPCYDCDVCGEPSNISGVPGRGTEERVNAAPVVVADILWYSAIFISLSLRLIGFFTMPSALGPNCFTMLVTLGSGCFTTAVPLEFNGIMVRFLILFLILLSIGSLLPPVSHARCFRGPVPFL